MKNITIIPLELYKGCILAAITHAVTVGEYPELNYEHSWDGFNYSMNNSHGCRATITFHPNSIVAVFQDMSKYDESKNAYDYFAGAPEDMIEIAKSEALQYVLEDMKGEIKPIITAAFWGDWENLYSNQPMDDIFANGGYIIENQLLSFKESLKKWEDYYGLNNEQMDFILSLYQRKLDYGEKTIVLNEKEVSNLYGDIDECKEALQELNIVFYESEYC